MAYPKLEDIPRFNKSEWQREYRKTEKGRLRESRWRHSEKCKAYKRKYQQANRAQVNLYKRAWKHGVTVEQVISLFKNQGEKCGICGKAITLSRADIDHDHRSGQVRGILCRSCNALMANHDKSFPVPKIVRTKTEESSGDDGASALIEEENV